MSSSSKHEQDIIKLCDRKDYPLWCVQVRNELRTKRFEEATQDDFEKPLRQNAVETLLDEGWRPQDCNDLKSLKDIHEKAKGDSIGIIQGRLHRNRLSLLEGKTTAREMWVTLQQEFDISRASEIGAIAARVMGKSFHEFDYVDSYCQTYQEAYNEIASRLVNNNGGRNQDKHYEVLLQGAMLEKLPEAYASLVATMDTEWTNYTSADLRETIYKILRFLKTDPLKIFHASSIPDSGQSNKRPRLAPTLPACSHPVCLSKKLRHTINKCWALHPELRPANRRKKVQLSDMKIRENTSNAAKDESSTFNLS